jgi:NAD(P)-dependent dehydrogenase (short-subunit alcohol dehydrogenase family)
MSERRIGVVGAGNMGSGIAQKTATEGFQVVLVDLDEAAARRGHDRIRQLLDEAVERRIFHEIRTGERLPDPTPSERGLMAIKQARLTLESTQMPPINAIRELRGQLLKYAEGLPYATRIRDGVMQSQSLTDIENAFAPLLEMA